MSKPIECNSFIDQMTILLGSFHLLTRLCLFFRLGFSSRWTVNYQLYKLGLEKTEDSEIKLPTLIGLWRKQGSSRKTSTSASLTSLKHLTVWITTNHGKFLKTEVQGHFTCSLRKLYSGQEATVRTGHGTTDWLQLGNGVYCHPACLTSMQITSCEMLS